MNSSNFIINLLDFDDYLDTREKYAIQGAVIRRFATTNKNRPRLLPSGISECIGGATVYTMTTTHAV
jgi:hypothetical protein